MRSQWRPKELSMFEFPVSWDAEQQRPCDPCRMPLRCLIVDDNLHFLEADRGVLEREGVTVVGVASTSSQAVQQTNELQPDVALLDIDLGGESGFELARRLQRETS